MIANDSSSSATSPSEPAFDLDLLAGKRLPALPAAFLEGRDRDLLEPLRFLAEGRPDALLDGTAPEPDRRELARGLAIANAAYGHPRAEELAERLADPATRVVVTGQQPGIYGGPLLTLTKMAAAVRWAEELTAAGQPAVALFWVATEDHDWAEATKTTVLAKDGPLKLDLGEDPSPLMPLGMRTLGANLPDLQARLNEALGSSAGRLRDAERWYRPDARVGEAFSRFMVSLLGDRAPLMLDSMLPEMKRLQRPWLRRLVERRQEVDEAYAAADREIEARGYPLQIRPQPGMSPLFVYHRGERRRVEWRGEDRYALRGLEGSEAAVSRLLARIDENPAVVSPGALARPALQDAVLGTTLQVMGPSELAYLAQASAVYPVLGIEAPWTSLRPQVMILEERQAKYLAELDVGLGELLDVPLDQLLASKLGEDFIAPARQAIDELLDGLREPVLAVDPSLEKPLRRSRDQVGRTLDQLAGKVAAAVARRHEVWQRRLDQIHQAVLPAGHLQERELSVAYFLSRFGRGFGDELCSRLDLEPRHLHVLRMSPAPRPAAESAA